MVPPAGQQHLVGPNGRRGGEHLPEWMAQHQGMTLEQQQRALDREPGFRELPLQTQIQMHQRLAQLNAMTPEHAGADTGAYRGDGAVEPGTAVARCGGLWSSWDRCRSTSGGR